MGRAHLPASKSEMGTKSARPEDTAKQKPVHHTIFRPTNFCPTKSEPWAPWLICVKRIKSHKSISRSIFCNISLWNALSIECSLPSPLRILYDTRIAPGQTPEIVKISGKIPVCILFLLCQLYKTFTGTTSYYKMLPLRGPTPLLQNTVGVLMVDQWPMLARYKKVGGQPKMLPFLNSYFVWCMFRSTYVAWWISTSIGIISLFWSFRLRLSWAQRTDKIS